jgi:hypothetical protein
VPAVRDLRRAPKVYESGPAEMHAPRQAAAPYARAIISSSLRVSSAKAKAELDRIRQAPPTGMARASRPLPAAMDIPRTCAVSPADQEAALLTAYRAFNARDIDRALAVMTDDIDWPNGWEGGRVSGKDAVRHTGPASGRISTRMSSPSGSRH